jgi:hypothetical protein
MARPRKTPDGTQTNAHSVAVHIGDGRVIEPGETIPADVEGDTLAALLASGFFG